VLLADLLKQNRSSIGWTGCGTEYVMVERSHLAQQAFEIALTAAGSAHGGPRVWWALFDQVSGGLAGRAVLVGLVASLGIEFGGWACLRLQPVTGRSVSTA